MGTWRMANGSDDMPYAMNHLRGAPAMRLGVAVEFTEIVLRSSAEPTWRPVVAERAAQGARAPAHEPCGP